MNAEREFLRFVQVSSFVQPSFWNKFSDLKINVDKLDENERNIYGNFSNVSSTWSTHVVEVDSTSFNAAINVQNQSIPFHGKLFNKNTIERFRYCDKTELINKEGRLFLEHLKSGEVLETPSLLNFFFILSFIDLKRFHFYYWFAFPIPHNLQIILNSISPISSHMSEAQVSSLSADFLLLDAHQKSYFLVRNNATYTLKEKLPEINSENYGDYYFTFGDYLNDVNHPKAQLKNYIVLLLYYCPFLGGKSANFLLLSLDKRLSCAQSVIYNLTLPVIESPIEEIVSWAGWEKNEKNKFAPRFSNMKTTMDPEVLFEESVDLNLKLMKWRLLPNIDLEKIKSTKCLLLGSGTLGCSVARNLLGWGVRNITFVDNSTVSYSNPVRQHLFNYEDAICNKPKAQAAADNLRKIFPTINSRAHQFTIPMPGHNVGQSTVESVMTDVTNLKTLIEGHDVIFLLTDSRESRWLPTLLGIFCQKLIINVALGFDTYLVMRYGRAKKVDCDSQMASSVVKRIEGTALGCYFCNDVTAPGNSLKDRTLDQQCTVTRPGVSSVAGALAVELAISLTQHEAGIDAPAFYRTGLSYDLDLDEDQTSILGIIPHSIRGFLSSFTHVLPATPRYSQCIACSDVVLQEYCDRDFGFLLEVFNSTSYLENLTGLSALFQESNFADVLEIDDEDFDD